MTSGISRGLSGALLPAVLAAYASKDRGTPARGFFNSKSESLDTTSYGELSRTAFALANYFRSQQLKAGDSVIISCSRTRMTVTAFYAAVLAGIVPIIVPSGVVQGRARALNHAVCIARQFNRFAVITDKASRDLERSWVVNDQLLNSLPAAAQLQFAPVERDDLAFIQLTSSTTGQPKGIGVTHGNLVENVHGIRVASSCTDEETVVSWLPLYHDMGLVGAELFSCVNGYSFYSMTPFEYVKEPSRWIRAISDTRATLSVAPNFGYEYAAANCSDESLAGCDISCWKRAYNGAEPVSVRVLQLFLQRFAPLGFSRNTFVPCYGLAEATLAVTMHYDGSEPLVREFQGADLRIGAVVKSRPVSLSDASSHSANILYAVSCGKALPGTTVSIRTEDGVALEEGSVGEIFVCGPGVAPSMFADTSARQMPKWLATGDLGVVADGKLFILERLKNIVIRNGRNYAVSVLEEEIAKIVGCSVTDVAVVEEAGISGESPLVGIVELTAAAPPNVDLQAFRKLELPVHRLLYTKRNSIPRTTSGKKRHYLCRQLLSEGGIDVIHCCQVL